jgi:hypothetical protein
MPLRRLPQSPTVVDILAKSRRGCLVAAAVALLPSMAAAQSSALLPAARLAQLAARASLGSPAHLTHASRRPAAPVWLDRGLLPQAPEPRALFGLAAVEKPGIPLFDAASRTWDASANGCLVEVRLDGRLPVLLSGVQGIDVDVRGARGVAVSREPDHTIVLHRWDVRPERRRAAWYPREAAATNRQERRVLLRGSRYFRPRLSPDGTRLIVGESRASGGHIWMLSLDGDVGGSVDLGEGSGGAWLPDGRRVVFSRVEHDGHRITGADLWWVDTATRRRAPVARTPHLHEIEPAVSPDGTQLVFVDARSGDLMLAPTPAWMR